MKLRQLNTKQGYQIKHIGLLHLRHSDMHGT